MNKMLVCLGLFCACMAALGQKESPDLILFNGKMFTGVGSRPYVQALAIRRERIVATGDTPTIRAMAGEMTKQVDLHGRTVIPGLNDAHHHLELKPTNQVDVDAGTMDPTWQQAREAILAAIAKSPAGSLMQLGIGDTIWEDVSINRDALDKIAPHTPVMLVTIPGHGFILNTAALRFYGVRDDQPDPVGGRLERDAKGRLTGTLREYAAWNMQRALANAMPDQVAVGEIRQALKAAERFGVTTIQELSIYIPPARLVKLLEAVPTPVRIRVVRMPGTTPAGRDTKEGLGMQAHPSDLISVNGTKWLVDGVPVEGTFTPRGAWKIPALGHLDDAVHDLPLTFSKQEIAAMLRESLENNDELLLHVSGYQSAKAVLDAMDASGGTAVWQGRRLRFEHGDGVFPDLQERVKEYGIVVVQNPSHLMTVGVLGMAPTGADMFTKAQPVKSLLKDGIPLAMGSDGQTNPFLDIMFATMHVDRPSEAITREQAVTAYTLGSAYAEFQEREKGTLEAGKLADLAVLSQDIFTAPTPELPKTVSVLTIVGGKIVYKDTDLK